MTTDSISLDELLAVLDIWLDAGPWPDEETYSLGIKVRDALARYNEMRKEEDPLW